MLDSLMHFLLHHLLTFRLLTCYVGLSLLQASNQSNCDALRTTARGTKGGIPVRLNVSQLRPHRPGFGKQSTESPPCPQQVDQGTNMVW